MSDKGRDDLKQVAAKIKEEAGELLGDGEAAREGRREQTEGAAEAKGASTPSPPTAPPGGGEG